jgi:perosamine synthetase
MGDIGVFSFYANKLVTTGEGGMVVTNNKRLAEKAQRLKDLAHSTKRRFMHTELGYNYRMTNMQAAVGLAQLSRIKETIRKKRKIASAYYDNLRHIQGIRLPSEAAWARSVYWMYAILVEKELGISRDRLRTELAKAGIETRTFFVPMHQQPVIKKLCPVECKKRYAVAEHISKSGLYLPTGLTLQRKDILYVCDALKRIKSKIS